MGVSNEDEHRSNELKSTGPCGKVLDQRYIGRVKKRRREKEKKKRRKEGEVSLSTSLPLGRDGDI